MAASYVLVTLLIVLLLETLVVAVGYIVFTLSPMTDWWAMQQAGQAARVFALQAAVQADSDELNPATTFEPDRPESLSVRRDGDPPNLSWFELEVPYLSPGSSAPARPTFALLIDANERVMASSFPDRYPASTSAAEALPAEIQLVRGALEGSNMRGEVQETTTGDYAAVVHPVLNREGEPIGAVYVRMPTGGPADPNLLVDVGTIILPSGLFWLCLMLPIGMLFGVLTTRGLIRRIERLATATARFKEGDTATRVPVARADEIGQLEQQFNQMAEQIIESFAQRQALVEQSARREERARIEQEMSSAHYIQKSLLPETVPTIPGWQLQALYLPALEVGGDLYDILSLPDGRVGILIGDANGKGVPSALIMATAVAMLRAAAPGAATPGQVLRHVNNLMHVYIPSGTFITCFFAILDPASGQLCYANAGHNIPYLARGGELTQLRVSGMPLGLMPEQDYEENSISLDGADYVLFYTDGLVEAHDGQGEMYGGPRLKARIQEHPQADGLIEHLLRDLHQFVGPDWMQEDDVTMVMLKKNP